MPHRLPAAPRPFVALATLLLCGSLVAAQEPVEADFGDQVTVSEVILDVVVTDRSGQIVVGLDRDDFRVEEEGEPVEIREAVFYSHRELMDPAAAERLNADPDLVAHRYFVLFFHDQRQLAPILAARQLDAARWAKRWARKLSTRDMVAVLSYQYGLRPQADFTNDPEVIAAAIDRAVTSEKTPPSRLPAPGAGFPSLLASLPSGVALRDETTTVYDALSLVAEAAETIPGRKNLVLFSIGFDNEDDGQNFRPDPRYFPRVIHTLNDANLAVYAIDLAPSGASADPGASRRGNSLSYLATETGGEHYSTYVTVAAPLNEVIEATSGYYLLTYERRRPAGVSGYQEVEVTTENPRFRARARKGYLYGDEAPGDG